MDLRVLFVEDSADDAELMLRRLREAGIEPRWDRVQTEAALREALAGERWELALVDYNLPGFGGLQALHVLAEVAPDLPAITVSGAITEETAVTTIKAGAVDYVLKDNLTRLAPAVRRAAEGAELRRRERRAAEQARQTMYAIEHSSQAIFYVSESGVILYANEAAWSFGGDLPAEAVGQELWDWIPTIDKKRWGSLWRAASQHRIVDFQAAVRVANGEERSVLATLDLRERQEDPFVIVYVRDITEQRAVEERARASEERYARLADGASDIIFRYDFLPVAGLTYINPAVETMTGYTPDDCYADPQLMFTMVHPDDVSSMAELMASLTPPEEPLVMRWIGKDGVTRWMESRMVPVRDGEGRLLAVEGITRDVTERKRVEEELRFTRFVVEQAGDAVFWMTADGALTYANPATCDILGYSLDELRRMNIHDIDPAFPATRWPGHMQELEQAGSLTFETRHRTKSGALIPMEITANYLEYKGDVYDVAIARDITARKLAEDEIRRQAEQLRRTLEGAVLAMSNVVEARDPYTAGHERRVAELATAIAEEMGMEGEELVALRLAGTIHDVGKIAVPAEILSKPGRLSGVEFELIKQHPESGYEILGAIDFGRPVAEMVRQHHERLDGSGYPQGLSGSDILPEGRILAVADVVEAMSSHRPYRAALGMAAALAEVREHAGLKYDAEVVAACVRLFEEQGFALTP